MSREARPWWTKTLSADGERAIGGRDVIHRTSTAGAQRRRRRTVRDPPRDRWGIVPICMHIAAELIGRVEARAEICASGQRIGSKASLPHSRGSI